MIAAVIVLAAIVGGAIMLLGGGDDDPETSPNDTTELSNTADVEDTNDGVQNTNQAPVTNPTQTTSGGATTTQPFNRCTAESGRCVFITGIARDGDEFVATYQTVGYEPDKDGDQESRHIHFYFNTVRVDQAGHPATGPWEVWDVDENGELIYRLDAADVPPEATELCASVANVNHGLDDHRQHCVGLPS